MYYIAITCSLTKDDMAVLKLGDFGFAKVDQGDLTTPVFTPYYVAPAVSQVSDWGLH